MERERPFFAHSLTKRQKIRMSIIIVVAAIGIGIYVYTLISREQRAETAIQSVMDACGTGNRYLIAQRYTEALSTFRDVDPDYEAAYDVKLQNRIKFYGCSF